MPEVRTVVETQDVLCWRRKSHVGGRCGAGRRSWGRACDGLRGKEDAFQLEVRSWSVHTTEYGADPYY